MENKRSKVAERHIDRKDLKPLQVGDAVRMQPIDKTCEWKEATVTQRLKSRTYNVTTSDGRNYRRNRVFLRSTRRNPVSNSGEVVHRPTSPPSHFTHTPRPSLRWWLHSSSASWRLGRSRWTIHQAPDCHRNFITLQRQHQVWLQIGHWQSHTQPDLAEWSNKE